jgi:hypothetical protein
MADTQSRPVRPGEGLDDQLCHQVCCRDDNRALCGRDVTEAAWKSKGATFDCVVCDDLNIVDHCPLYTTCRGGTP